MKLKYNGRSLGKSSPRVAALVVSHVNSSFHHLVLLLTRSFYAIECKIRQHFDKGGDHEDVAAPPLNVVKQQARAVCQDILHVRLTRLNLLPLRAELRQSSTRCSHVVSELLALGDELERLHPVLYSNVATHVRVTLHNEAVVSKLVEDLALHLFQDGAVTWCRVASLLSLCAALSAECTRQGRPGLVSAIVDAFCVAVDSHALAWIVQQGGWLDVVHTVRAAKYSRVARGLGAMGAVLSAAAIGGLAATL